MFYEVECNGKIVTYSALTVSRFHNFDNYLEQGYWIACEFGDFYRLARIVSVK